MIIAAKVCKGGAVLHPQGVQRGVQRWAFVRVTRKVGNPVIVHRQFLPLRYKMGHNRPNQDRLCPILRVF